MASFDPIFGATLKEEDKNITKPAGKLEEPVFDDGENASGGEDASEGEGSSGDEEEPPSAPA